MHIGSGGERMRVGRGCRNRMFQSSMHPCIHIFIRSIAIFTASVSSTKFAPPAATVSLARQGERDSPRTTGLGQVHDDGG